MESEMSCCERIKFAMSKLLMEAFGTFVFTLLFLTGNQLTMLIGLWVLTIFCWKISASHLNPAVTLAFMFRNDSKKVHFTLGLLMMGAQVAGAYLGALYIAFVSWGVAPLYPVESKYAFDAMMQEILGTFIFVLFFKIVTDERLHFSKENAINCFIIAAAYVAARTIVNGSRLMYITSFGACLNPAVAVGITLVSVMNDAGTTFTWFWLYWLMPFVGSIIAIIFYRFVYLKTQLMIMKDEAHHEEEEENVADAMGDMMSQTKKGFNMNGDDQAEVEVNGTLDD